MKSQPLAATLVAILLLPPSAAAAEAAGAAPAIAVSPGGIAKTTETDGRCPTFSWSVAAGAAGSELAVYALRGEQPELQLRRRIAGAAGSWTPPRADCLAPGEYGWMVRALPPSAAAAGEPAGEAAAEAWSAPLRFRVPGAPTEAELRSALAVLERWRAGAGGSPPGGLDAGPVDAVTGSAAPGAPEVDPGSSVAALRAVMPNASGAAYGVLAVSHSPQGAGVVARNESGGPDLVLDGTANGAVDALLSQGGIDLPAAGAQTFNIQNSGSGALTLQVDGVAVDTATTPLGWSRLTGVPAGFADGVDNDTVYAAGNQLQLTGTTFHVVEGQGSGLDADTLDGASSLSFQRRVTGTCPLGLTLQGINTDGSVVCYAPFGLPQQSLVEVGNGDNSYSSIAIGADGLPILSFHDAVLGTLRVAKCNDPACAGGDETVSNVDTGANYVGRYNAIAILDSGLPVIAYQDVTAGALKVARCTDVSCTGSNEVLSFVEDGANVVGSHLDLAIGADGRPVISYHDETATALKVAKCNDSGCVGGNETLSFVDNLAAVGLYTSIAIGSGGLPVISYYDETNTALEVVRCNDPACENADEVPSVVDDTAAVGLYTSIAIGADGLPVVSYHDATNGALKVAKCNDLACSGGNETISTVEDGTNVGTYSALAVGADGLPVISYYDAAANRLRVAKCNDAACAGGDETFSTVFTDGGVLPSIAIGTEGFPVISFRATSNGAVRVTKCRNTSCAF